MSRAITSTAVLAALALAACAARGPASTHLVEARAAYRDALASPAPRHASAELQAAQRVLNDAELVHREAPGSAQERHLAYLALRHAQLAIALAGGAVAARDLDAARLALVEAQRRHGVRDAAALTMTQQERDRLARENAALAARAQQLEGGAATLQEREAELARTEAELAAERDARTQLERERDEALAKLNAFADIKETDRGTVITLGGALLFRTNRATLLPSARAKLDQVATALRSVDTDQSLVIEGHADARGSADANRRLSAARAEAVRAYLIERGVPRDKLVSLGKGEDEPIASNRDAEGRATNRRVEIVITRPQAASATPVTQPR